MSAFLIFIVLPLGLIVASFFIRPLVQRDRRLGDPFGESMAAGGMFGSHGLDPDERTVPEEDTAVRFQFNDVKNDDVKKRE